MPAKEFTVKWLDQPNEKLLNGKTQVSYFERQRRGRALMLVVGRETKTWRVRFYEKGGRSNSAKLGRYPDISLADARDRVSKYDPEKAREEALEQAAKAKAAAEVKTFRDVAETWIKRHVEPNNLRTMPELVRCLNVYVYPAWADIPFQSVRRKHIAELLDNVADNHGPSMANSVLALVSALMGWYETRDEDYVTPIGRGMRKPTTPRSRKLSDEEIRMVWKACDESGSFGALLQLCLLTAQRSRKVATMHFSDLRDNVWTIATEPREKTNGGVLILPEMAMEIIEAQRRNDDNPFVFPGQGKRPFGAFSFFKARLDEKLPDVPHWTPHDLRRTARSLLSRKAAGIPSDIAERLLGHSVGRGVEATYDRHDYTEEKAEALQALARMIKDIVEPPPPNVVAMKEARGVAA